MSWTVPLDQDHEHATYEPDQVAEYFDVATRAALVLAEFRAPYRGRSTRVNAWWGSFDLSVNLFSGLPADPPANDFITRNSMDAQEVAIGWWPGDDKLGESAFYAYAHPAPEAFSDGSALTAAAHWNAELGLYALDWNDIQSIPTRMRARSGSPARHSSTRVIVCELGPRAARERRRETAAA